MTNYFVIGADNSEYGPVPAEELRKWVAQGRANAETKVRLEGSTEWAALSHFPELGGAPAQKTAPAAFSASSAPTNGKTSFMAIASLVLGIFGLFTCGITALFGLVLGIIAMVRVTRSQGALRGKGIGLAGVIISGVVLLMIPFFAAMLLPALSAAKQKATAIVCMNNEKQLALGMIMYTDAHTNTYPPAASWCDAIQSSVASVAAFKCPAASNMSSRCDYAFNANLDGRAVAKVNPQTVMLFEADGGWNAHGGVQLAVARHGRHEVTVAFADGHVESVSNDRLASLRWEP